MYRLAQLLDAEDRMYEQEFMANLETPEQVREKMAQRLQELKEKRESERQDEVQRRLE
jgi:Spy/CpxP family protein refolding chaperone